MAPLRNPLLRGFTGFVLYLLLPLVMLAFTWKAAVFPAWGAGLLCATAAVVAGHLLLPDHRSWREKARLSVGAALLTAALILAAAIVYSQTPIRRPFDLFRADLSNQWLVDSDLRRASLFQANLAGADLYGANLAGAYLNQANLTGADLGGADLADTLLSGARFTSEEAGPAHDLTQAQLDGTWAWASQPPEGLDRLDPPLALSRTRLCDPGLRDAWANEFGKLPPGERRYGPPADCFGAAGAAQ